MLGFAIAIAIVNGILFGPTPALRVASRGIADSLRDSGARGSVGCARSRLRSSLVIAEVSVAVMLVLVGGVSSQASSGARHDPGFDRNVLGSIVVPTSNQYDTIERHELLFHCIVDAVRAVSGV